jgi:magnesium chelatase family protein
LKETSPLTTEQKKTLTNVSSKQSWSNRVQTKIIRLARTISDLAGEERISDQAIWEAMTLRRLGMNKQQVVARET